MTRIQKPHDDETGRIISSWTVLEYLGKNNYKVRCKCGTERIKRGTVLGKRSHSCGCEKYKIHQTKKSKDLSGLKFGCWEVLNYAGESKFNCKCVCGKENAIRRSQLVTGDSKSCGCMANVKTSEELIESVKRKVYLTYKNRASNGNREFTLNEIEFIELVKQNCFYCGSPPSNSGRLWNKKEVFYYSGLDRIINEEGYHLDNVVPSCKICNIAKRSMTQEDFLNHVIKIVKHLELV